MLSFLADSSRDDSEWAAYLCSQCDKQPLICHPEDEHVWCYKCKQHYAVAGLEPCTFGDLLDFLKHRNE